MTSGYRGNGVRGSVVNGQQIQNGAVDYPKLSAAAQGALLAGGHRNLLINPLFNVNQRTYAGGAVAGANAYTWDRWRVVVSGQSAPVAAGLMTAPAGGVEQVVEGANIIGGTYVLSWTGTASATINGVAVANGAFVNLPANTNATVRLSGGTVSLPQLERGTVPTVFDQRFYQQELALCQRYYLLIPQVMSGGGCGVNGNGYFTDFTLPVTMRVAPTATYSNVTYLNGTGLVTNSSSTTHLRTSFSSTATSTAYSIADISLSAEL